MKKTIGLISTGERMNEKYHLKTANPNNLSYKLMDLVQEMLEKQYNDPKYADKNIQHAMNETRKAMNSLIMALTAGKLTTGVDPVEINEYDE